MTDPQSSNLLTCPFCGHTARLAKDDEDRWQQVVCGGCGAKGPERMKYGAVAAWNRRPVADFVGSLKIAEAVFAQYRIDQPKWWKRMDGTPILNDVAVRMAEAFRATLSERAAFKNFHRLLCERFGYGHDEVAWERDQLSLIEWIAKRPAPETSGEDAWLLVFADQDVKSELFTGHGAEDAARSRFEQAKASWTCRLFRSVASTGYASPEETAERRDYAAVRDAHDRTVEELERYKKALYTANGFLIQRGWEPVKLEYSEGNACPAVEPKSTAIPDCEPGCDCDFCHAPPVKALPARFECTCLPSGRETCRAGGPPFWTMCKTCGGAVNGKGDSSD